MPALFRSLLAMVMALSLLGFTAAESFGASAGLAAEMPAQADHCCDGGCPDDGDEDCDGGCAMMLRCGASFTALLAASSWQAAPRLQLASIFPNSLLIPSGVVPEGLKRPPRI